MFVCLFFSLFMFVCLFFSYFLLLVCVYVSVGVRFCFCLVFLLFVFFSFSCLADSFHMFEMVRLSVGLEAQKAGIESNCQDSFSLSFCRWLLIHNQYKNSGLI